MHGSTEITDKDTDTDKGRFCAPSSIMFVWKENLRNVSIGIRGEEFLCQCIMDRRSFFLKKKCLTTSYTFKKNGG